ncbi:putative nucleotide-binding alpha-beta plait domain superfamily, RNA-binding domain superfamily [Helianthus annuus]|uniref:Nucleotide-binding alpha-beta plait domain superfamily, RNA-binding domain superfamily n=1 Tax=Helianthus annuus TaxID=4232 RepID=A0A9K3DQK8_HELAN|nr:putative nucleotide-binding alpha-beta plait domain superfamily, RNA-binding domain superfamily [Helianthus annuus]KAJ0441022.1 putative nucleotide-binding alpha-beta plait domain superfamily, RNA-binding domain superfamily [Helianthus annuus]KAJ0819699.1 putative nucleotide-binding alpha-beta plait domain superfamily, RNA-binding domain superfamily [Helianthus annuus]
MFLLPFICFLSVSGNSKKDDGDSSRLVKISQNQCQVQIYRDLVTRGFGFVTFAEDDVADRVSRRSHEICGQQVLVAGSATS